jgi:hypothetical protein
MTDIVEQKQSKVLGTSLDTALKVLEFASPTLAALTEIVIGSAKETEQLQENGTLSELDQEAKRQAIALNMARIQAIVAQELAIAERIKNANEVEIEEYYETERSANANASLALESVSLDLGGSSHRVTKRIYRFMGNNQIAKL